MRTTCFLLIIFLFCGCASQLKRPKPHQKTALKPHFIKSKDGRLKLKALSRGPIQLVEKPNLYYFLIPLGATSAKAMECYLRPIRPDAAQAAFKFMDDLKVSSTAKGFGPPLINSQDWALVNRHGAFINDLVVFKKNSNDFTTLKALTLTQNNETLACVLNFPKSNQSFVELVSFLAKNLRFDSGENPFKNADFRQIYVLKSGKQIFGQTEINVVKLPEDKRKIVTLTSTLSPGNPTTYIGSDWASFEIIDENGDLLSAQYIQVRNGDMVYNIALVKTDSSAYQVSGTYYTKDIFQKLTLKTALKSSFHYQTLLLQDAELEKKQFTDIWQFLPHFSIKSPFYSSFHYSGKHPEHGKRYSATFDHFSIDFLVKDDNFGHLIVTQIGKDKIHQEKVLEEGRW